MNKNMIFIFILLVVAFLSINFFLLNDSIGKSNNHPDKILINRLYEYYDYEKENNWAKTYYFRTPLYQKTVLFDFYTKNMEKDNDGWQLIEYKVLKSIQKGNYAIFKISFIEKVPRGFFPTNKIDKTNLDDFSTWEKINGIWYCRDACSRLHLNLNEDLVMKNDQREITKQFEGQFK